MAVHGRSVRNARMKRAFMDTASIQPATVGGPLLRILFVLAQRKQLFLFHLWPSPVPALKFCALVHGTDCTGRMHSQMCG